MYTFPHSKDAHSGLMNGQGQSDIILSWSEIWYVFLVLRWLNGSYFLELSLA